MSPTHGRSAARATRSLVESAKQVVGDQKLLVKYREDLDARRTFDTTMAMQSYVYNVDSYVGLSADQWEPVRQICAKLYREGKCRRTCIDSEESSIEREQLSRTLTESQLDYLQRFKPKWTGGEEPENLAPVMREVAEMRVRQVDAVVQLSPQQRTKLQFAAKRTMIRRFCFNMGWTRCFRKCSRMRLTG